ncbi:hypothetical protein MKK58_18020 [Methylobacterium sp. J-078]|uniref:hypothetical protein n=1 Tax=Methylobacterium sp. J-078 TaxID=2836657 RepID=UPI001FB9750B|nr:hypothetical protein [Methylobacterium sp. J-078]MCJ2046415.1 hypothetical protein [Methylobacterium sp. J-078]
MKLAGVFSYRVSVSGVALLIEPETDALTRFIHRGLADDVFWSDVERDRASTVTRMDSDRCIGV